MVDLDQSVDSWTAKMKKTLEVGGSLALVGNELLEDRAQQSSRGSANASVLSNDSGQ
jgi:hypothetical protein